MPWQRHPFYNSEHIESQRIFSDERFVWAALCGEASVYGYRARASGCTISRVACFQVRQ